MIAIFDSLARRALIRILLRSYAVRGRSVSWVYVESTFQESLSRLITTIAIYCRLLIFIINNAIGENAAYMRLNLHDFFANLFTMILSLGATHAVRRETFVLR